jgi:hypothetical protein
MLPASVLAKLYNFIIRPLHQPLVKHNRMSKGIGTGGLKRKSMDEDLKVQKICQLKDHMKLFEKTANVHGNFGLAKYVFMSRISIALLLWFEQYMC